MPKRLISVSFPLKLWNRWRFKSPPECGESYVRDRSAVIKILRGINSRIIQDLNATSQNHLKNIKESSMSQKKHKKQRTRKQQKHQKPYYLFLGNYTTFIPTKNRLYKKLQSELSHFSRGGGCPEPCFGAGTWPISMTTDLWLSLASFFVSLSGTQMFSTLIRFVDRSISGGLVPVAVDTMYLCDGSDSKVPGQMEGMEGTGDWRSVRI